MEDARFNLAQCKMLAPDDGYVVNWQVQIGTMLVPAPLAAAGTFVNVSDTAVAAVFPQNWLSNVEPGNDVEMVLNPYPGRLFRGKVDYVISASGGGQFTTSGTIPNAARIGSDGLYAVRINFSDDAVARAFSRVRGIGDYLHEQGQGYARHFEGRDPDEEVAALCHALCGKAVVVGNNGKDAIDELGPIRRAWTGTKSWASTIKRRLFGGALSPVHQGALLIGYLPAHCFCRLRPVPSGRIFPRRLLRSPKNFVT